MSKFVWGTALQEENWKPAFPEPRSEWWLCAWAGAKPLAEGTAAVPTDQSLAGSLCPTGTHQPSCQEPLDAGKGASNRCGAAPQAGEGTVGAALFRAGTWFSYQLGFLEGKEFYRILGQVFLHRGYKCLVLYLGVTQTIPTCLFVRQLVLNKLVLSLQCARDCCFVFIFISASPQRPYHNQGIIFHAYWM